jgi:hypothetical protein
VSVRVGIVDSGVHAEHPHIGGVAGGVGIGCYDYVDRIGHGTAVAAAIREKAPAAELYAVKIFHERLAAPIERLVAGIDWCIAHRMQMINLSLGTQNPAHEAALRETVARLTAAGVALVAPRDWLPGSLAGVVPVALDWECPREEYRTEALPDGRTLYRASGYPRAIPHVPVEQNLKGISFAVANVTGLLACASCAQTDQDSCPLRLPT